MEKRSYEYWAGNYDEHGVPSKQATYNEYGDYILPHPNNTAYRTFGEKKAYYNTIYFPVPYIDALNAVFALYQARGAVVLFGYSPRSALALSEDSSLQIAVELDRYLRQRLTAPVIGNIQESIWDAFYFWETDNHLSTDGVKRRTQIVINDMLAYPGNRT